MSGEQVLFGLLIFNMTGSSFWVGVALALYFGSSMVVGILAGGIADWLDRRQLLRLLECAIVAIFTLTALLLWLGDVGLWQMLTLVFVAGSLRALQHPLRSSYVYDLMGAKNIVAGLGMMNLCSRGGQLVGALVSGFAMKQLGADSAYLLLAGAHLTAFLLLLGLRSAGESAVAASAKPNSLGQVFSEYGREFARNRLLVILVAVTAVVEVLGFSFVTALPEFALERLGVGAENLGFLYAIRSVGGMIAGIVWASWGSPNNPGKLYIGVIFILGSGLLVLAFATALPLIVIALLIVAIGTASTDVLSQSMMQLCVSNHLRGRAMGAWQLAIGLAPLGHLEMGFLVAAIGVTAALTLNAIGVLLIALWVVFFVPNLRR